MRIRVWYVPYAYGIKYAYGTQQGRKTALSGYYECVETHTIFYNFKTALYSSAIVMKGFTSSRKLF